MDASQLQELFNRYVKGTASPEEENEFLDAVEQSGQTELLKQLIDQHFNTAGNDRGVSEAAGYAILESIFLAGQERKKKPVPVIFWRRMAVAASILVALATGWILLRKQPEPATLSQKIVFKNDKAPGASRATLSLADGSVIVLDSVANGNLAQQGNTRIIKLNEGQLVYNNASGTAAGWNTITTPNGGQYQVILPDGSRAWLNAASTIRFPTAFNEPARSIDVTGEVYLDIAQIPSKPFIVNIDGRASVNVIGTSFNINAYTDEPAITTTLVSGKIKIAADGLKKENIMQPGQQAVISQSSLSIRDNIDLGQVTAWKNGYFHFNGTDLPAVMRQIARWYNISVEYKGKIPDKQFWGELPRNLTLQQLIKLLRFGKISLELKDNSMTIIGE